MESLEAKAGAVVKEFLLMKSCSHPLLSFQADQNSPGGPGIVFSGSQYCCSRKAMFLVQLGAKAVTKSETYGWEWTTFSGEFAKAK